MGFIFKSSKPKINTNSNSNSNNSSKESWGMGFFLVFFPEDQNNNNQVNSEKNYSPLSSFSPTRVIKRTNSNNIILTRTQSTITICVFLVFLTFLLFTLSTFEPNIPHATTTAPHRRFLHEKTHTNYSFLSSFTTNILRSSKPLHATANANALSHHALQRMGVLYRKGTKAMNDLVVAHVVEHVLDDEFRLFLRLLHRSGVTSKADIVFIFAASSSSSRFGHIFEEEDYSFMKLVELYNTPAGSKSVFDLTQFVKNDKQVVEPIWGGRRKGNNSSNVVSRNDLTRLSYGSIVGFEANELDPENSLSGFLEHVTMSLRRWACYPMLLGRVKRKFKHIMLIDVKNELIIGDPMARVRSKNSDSVHLFSKQENVLSKHGKKAQSHNSVIQGIIMGGERGIRRFSSAMLNEIVRAAMQHKKKKNSVTESGVLSQLVGSEFILKDSVSLVLVSAELVPEASQLVGSSSQGKTSTGSVLSLFGNYSVIQRGNSHNNVNSVIREQLCSCEVDSGVYRDCLAI